MAQRFANGTYIQSNKSLFDVVHVSEASNATTKFREAFETFVPGVKWNLVSKDANDIVQIEGNAASASYLVISKDPFTANSVTTIESTCVCSMPHRVAAGISLSQRTQGQEFTFETVSADDPTTPFTPKQITTISQTTTTLTANTAVPHGLAPGDRICIEGVNNDSRLNYPQVVVATTPAANQFTVTAGPSGGITSIPSAGPYSPTAAYVSKRSAMLYAKDGTSMVFENSTATNASFYVRSNSGEVLPSGTINGAHGVTIASTASAQLLNTTATYAFAPTSQYEVQSQLEAVTWHDVAVDVSTGMTLRHKRTQVVPDANKNYKLRFRATNVTSLSRPVAKIVSSTKAGSTTATIVTDVAHGLTTGDYVVIYGNRDQTNFANLTTATVVASVINATSFTIAYGASTTATTYGGYVAKVNGNFNVPGIVSMAVQSVQRTSNILTVVGSAAWSGILIGDFINLYGVRDNTTGADVGVDGVYRVRDIATTNLILEPVSAPTGIDIGATNAGGAVIKRTDYRLHFARIFEYDRMVVESFGGWSRNDQALAEPVFVTNGITTTTTISGTPNVNAVQSTKGTAGAGWLFAPDNILVNDIASAAITSTTTTSAITPTVPGAAAEFNIIVSAAPTGTSPTMDVGIEESDDSGTSWYRIYDFPRITAAGAYRTPLLTLTGNRLRYVQTIGGTTPSFTRTLNRIVQYGVSPPLFRQIVDRSIVLTTLNSTTPTLKTNGVANIQMVINVGAITTTAPILTLEGSDDNGASWYAFTPTLTALASSTVQLTVNNICTDLIRARVSTAGVGVTAGYVLLRAFSF